MGQLLKKLGLTYRRNLARKGKIVMDAYRFRRANAPSVVVILTRVRGLSDHYCKTAIRN